MSSPRFSEKGGRLYLLFTKLGIRNNKREFIEWLDTNSPNFELLQKLANGTKHCTPVHSTNKVAGYGQGPYGIGPYGAPYLLIDLGDSVDNAKRYLVASTILGEIVQFWEIFFTDKEIRGPGNDDTELQAGSQE